MKNNNIMKILSSQTIKSIMSQYKKTMTDISRDFHIPYRTVQNWCGGVSRPPIYVLHMISEIYYQYENIDNIYSKLEHAQDLIHDNRVSEAIEIIDNI